MSDTDDDHYQQLTDAISLSCQGGHVHLNLSRHLDEQYDVFLGLGILMPPLVARQLGEALIEAASLAAEPAVAP